MANNTLCSITHLKKWFPLNNNFFSKKQSYCKAVDGITFTIKKGETLGLVGESGCGKTTVGRTLVRLYEPTGGDFSYNSQNKQYSIFSLSEKQFYPLKREIQMIFQDPYASLNPRMTVKNIIEEGMCKHAIGANAKEREELIVDILKNVGLQPEYMRRYPHEFSGGQRQRIGIARALVVKPQLIICDEPVSALDVSVQAQVINLLEELKESFSLTYLFIAHDLSVVKHSADRIAVMYLGKIVEIAETDTLFTNPMHPYTKMLFESIPVPNPHKRKSIKKILLKGEIPSPIDPPDNCRFHSRCPSVMDICKEKNPDLYNYSENQEVACFLYNKNNSDN